MANPNYQHTVAIAAGYKDVSDLLDAFVAAKGKQIEFAEKVGVDVGTLRRWRDAHFDRPYVRKEAVAV